MLISTRYGVLCSILASLLLSACSEADPDVIVLGTIQLEMGEHDRRGKPVRFQCNLEEILRGKVAVQATAESSIPLGYELRLLEQGSPDTAIPVQWDAATRFPWEKPGKGALVWIMDDRDAMVRNLDLVLTKGEPLPSPFTITDRVGQHLIVRSNRSKVLQYNYGVVRQSEGKEGPYDRAAYLHPVWTPTGQVITGDFSPEHIHQRGLFLAYRLVKFGELETDFWGLGESSGRILPAEVSPESSTGPVLAKLTIHNRGDVFGRTYFREVWGIRVYNLHRNDFWLFDIEVRQLPVGDIDVAAVQTMDLGKIHYGGMSFRGPSTWLHREGSDVERALSQGVKFPDLQWLPPEMELDVLTSEGNTRSDGNGKAAQWIDYTGPVGEGWAGLAMLGYRENPRHPVSLRIHPELPYFSYALTQDASLTIYSDQSLDQRFRVLVHDGRPDARQNERFGSDFNDPIKVGFAHDSAGPQRD